MDPARRKAGRWLALVAVVLVLWLLTVDRGVTPDSDAGAVSTEPPSPGDDDPAPLSSEGGAGRAARASEAAAAAEVVLTGLVLERGTDRPLQRFTVAVGSDDAPTARTESGPDGRFALALRPGARAWIEVEARPGWSRGAPRRPLEPTERTGGADGIVLVVAPDPRAPVRGRVVDRRAGDPVRGLSLELHGEALDDPAALATDARGDFASADELPAGELALRLFDDAPEGRVDLGLRYLDHDAEAAEPREHVVEVDVGPTFEVDLSPTLDAGPWKARVVERRGAADDAGTLVRSRSGWALLEAPRDVEERAWTWRALRGGDGEPAWLRYPAVEHEPDPALRATLEVADRAETRRGEVSLGGTVGVHPGPLAVEVRPVGRLEGVVEDAGGEPVAGARLWLRPTDGGGPARGPWLSGRDGAFTADGLDPGPYELTLTTPLRGELTLAVRVDSGSNRLRDLVLPRADPAHAIRGTFACAYDHGPGTVLLEVTSERGRAVARAVLRHVGSPRRGEGGTSSFEISDLPAGTYRLRPEEIQGDHHWTPDEARLTTPAPAIEFRCLGRVPHDRARVSAVDRSTGTPVPAVEVLLGPVRQEPFTWPESRPQERWYRWPRHSPLPWTVWAPGYQPATGDPDEFGTGGPERELRVDLRRGFGMRLVFRERVDGAWSEEEGAGETWSESPPVPGVRVTTHTREPVGASDELGEVLVRLGAEPDALRLHDPRRVAVAVEDATPAGIRLPVVVVWMRVRP